LTIAADTDVPNLFGTWVGENKATTAGCAELHRK